MFMKAIDKIIHKSVIYSYIDILKYGYKKNQHKLGYLGPYPNSWSL